MNGNEVLVGLVAFGIVFISAGLMVAFTLLKTKNPRTFRSLPAFDRLRRAIGRVVEDGSRLHISLGRGGLATPQSASALAGLSLLRRLADLTSAGDRPPIATSGDAALTILSQATLQGAAESSGQVTFDPSAGRLTGLTPFSYAAGVIPSIHDENVSTTILMGNFGIEAALLTDTAERARSFSLAGSDNLAAQSVLYVSAQEPLIGEEMYAAGAYTDSGPFHPASLAVQDILRWLAILVIIGGALLKMVGIL